MTKRVFPAGFSVGFVGLLVFAGVALGQGVPALSRPTGSPLCYVEGRSIGGWSPTVASGVVTEYLANGLPPGLTMDSASGVITGTPRLVGNYTVRLGARNALGDCFPVDLGINIYPANGGPPTGLSLSQIDGQQKRKVTGTGLDPSSRIIATNLPLGMSVSTTDAALIGEPSELGHHALDLAVTNAYGQSQFGRRPIVSKVVQPWSTQTVATGTFDNLSDVCHNGNLYVAVGNGGLIWTSPDFTNWTARSSGTSSDLYSVIFGGGLFVATGFSGTIITSSDGINWTTRTTNSATQLLGAAHGNGTFVAVGSANQVLSSSDGITWTSRQQFTNNFSFQDIIYADGQFVAVGTGGRLITSPNGIDWTVRSTGTTNGISSIAYGNGRFVALALLEIIFSNDGITWQKASRPPSTQISSVTYGGGRFLATALNALFTSLDGDVWQVEAFARGGGKGIFAENRYSFVSGKSLNFTDVSRWVPVCDPIADVTIPLGGSISANLSASNNPTSFTAVNLPPGVSLNATTGGITGTPSAASYFEVSYYASNPAGPGSLGIWKVNVIAPAEELASASSGGWPLNVGRIRMGTTVNSTFSISNWDTTTTVEVLDVAPGLIFTRTSQRDFKLTGNVTQAGVYPVRFRITNSLGAAESLFHAIVWDTGWSHINPGPSLRSVEYGNGIFVGTDSTGATLNSVDGLVWNNIGVRGESLRFLNGRFIQVGANGFLASSLDGATWASGTTQTTRRLVDVAHGNGHYVAVGSTGTILRSADALTWSVVTAGTTSDFIHVEFFAGKFWAATANAGLFSSDDGVTWSAVMNPPDPSLPIGELVALSDRLMIIRTTDPTKVWTTRDGATWQLEPMVIRPSVYPNGSLIGPVEQTGGQEFSLSSHDFLYSRLIGDSAWAAYPTPRWQEYTDVAVGNGISILTTVESNEYTGSNAAIRYYRQGALWPPVLIQNPQAVLRAGEQVSIQLQGTNNPTRYHAIGLPDGLVMNPITGLISGIPTATQSNSGAWVVAENAAGISEPVFQGFRIRPVQGSTPGLSSPGSISGTVGTGLSYQIVAGNTDASTTYSVEGLPDWFTLNPATGLISGLPQIPEVFEITLRVTNLYGATTLPVLVSISPPTWTPRGSALPSSSSRVYFYNNMFVAVGRGFKYSTDGTQWNSATLAGVAPEPVLSIPVFTRLAFGNNLWVAVSQAGGIATATSPDQWEMRILPGYDEPTFSDIIFAEGVFVALRGSGISTSTDGVTWTQRAVPPPGVGVWSLAHNGGRFVAVGARETIMTSDDGMTWTVRNSNFNASDIEHVAWLNGEFLAFAGNSLLRSTDGITWTRSSFVPSVDVIGASYGSGGYIALCTFDRVYVSYDAVTWNLMNTGDSPDASSLGGVVYGNGRFVLSGSGFLTAEGLAPRLLDPGAQEAWVGDPFFLQLLSQGIPNSFNVSGVPGGLAFDNTTGQLSGIPQNSGDFTLVFSAENSTGPASPLVVPLRILAATGPLPRLTSSGVFSVRSTGPASVYQITAANLTAFSQISVAGLPEGLTYDSGTRRISGLVAAAGTSTASITITNRYGTTNVPLVVDAGDPSWQRERPMDASFTAAGVAAGNSRTVVVSSTGHIYVSSTPGTWFRRGSTSFGLSSIAFGNGIFAAVGTSGRIFTSTDGDVWTQQTSGTSAALTFVNFSNNLFLAVGASGTLLTSPDGVTWTPRSTGTTVRLETVCYGNGLYLVAGSNGIIRTSPDLATWTNRGPNTGISFSGAAWGNGSFVVIGSNRTVRTSPDGVSWTTTTLNWVSDLAFSDVTFGNGFFVAALERSIIYSVNGTQWLTALHCPELSLNTVAFSGGKFLAGADLGWFLSTPDPRVPSIYSPASIRAFVGKTLLHSLLATNSPTTRSILSVPDGLTFDQVTGNLAGIPTQPGRHTLTFRVANAFGYDLQTFLLEIERPPIDLIDPPLLTSINGEWFSFDFASEPDGSVFSSPNLPSGLTIDPVTGRVSGYSSETGFFNSQIVATHPNGNRSIWFDLLIRHPAPMLLLQPSDQAVPEGQDVVLQAVAVGAGEMTFRWRRNGQPLGESESMTGTSLPTLTIRSVSLADQGAYDLVVSNETGSSSTRPVTVQTLKSLVGWAERRGLPEGQSGPLDTPEFPGIPNIVAFALGIPAGGDANNFLPALVDSPEGFVYRFRTEEGIGGVSILVETSTTLGLWTSEGINLRKTSTGGGFENWEASVPDSGPRRFFRLRVILNP